MIRPSLAALAAALLLVAACGQPTTDDAEVRSFEDIAVGAVDITFAPDGRSGLLHVETSVDAVCAVVYGETDAFGSISTDDDMAGGAHDDHNARLVGLQPDTEYRYRLQGVDADGTLYQSETMTFRTPQAAPEEGPDALLPTSVAASSEFSASFAATNAIDGDLGTEWSSRGDGDGAWIELDMGEVVDVDAVAFMTRSMGDGSSITQTFTVTVDGGEVHGPFEAFDLLQPVEVSLSGRRFRFDVESSTGGNTGAVEVAVYPLGG